MKGRKRKMKEEKENEKIYDEEGVEIKPWHVERRGKYYVKEFFKYNFENCYNLGFNYNEVKKIEEYLKDFICNPCKSFNVSIYYVNYKQFFNLNLNMSDVYVSINVPHYLVKQII